MKKILKWGLILLVSMLGAFITYKLYANLNEWGFIVAFLGGATTMNIASFMGAIIDEKLKS